MRVASYNVHSCVGTDGREDAARVAQVIRELRCDAVGLQEVNTRDGPGHASLQLDYLADATGMHGVPGLTLLRHDGHFGNALLTRYPVRSVARHDFSFRRREPRGALDVTLAVGAHTVRLIVTHLGLRAAERRHQVRALMRVLESADPDHPVVVLADLNEWLPFSRPLRWMHAALGAPPAVRTFPARLPLLALDRVWARPKPALAAFTAHRSPLARRASDHLPVKALIRFAHPIR